MGVCAELTKGNSLLPCQGRKSEDQLFRLCRQRCRPSTCRNRRRRVTRLRLRLLAGTRPIAGCALAPNRRPEQLGLCES